LFIAVLGGVSLAKGGLYMSSNESDVVHMVHIVLRMTLGQIPHSDFSTPLGILAFWPISLFSTWGFGTGVSFILAQVTVAALLAPMVLRVANSRLVPAAAWAFGAVVMILILALVHDGTEASQSVAMYYNRWAWAVSFVVLCLALIAPYHGNDAPRLDGLLIGLLMAVLALLKPTFFIAFAAPVLCALMLRRAWMSLALAVLTGGAVAAMMGLAYGGAFYSAYVHDMLDVVASELRSAPGVGMFELVTGPRFLMGNAALVLAIIMLFQVGHRRASLMLALLAPAFLYVTYQNFGNDPKWLLFLCVYLLAVRERNDGQSVFGIPARYVLLANALLTFALAFSSLQNLTLSPFRHALSAPDDYHRLIPNRTDVRDVWMVNRERKPQLESTLFFHGQAEEEPQFLGELLPDCEVEFQGFDLQAVMADQLKTEPFGFDAGTQFYVADIASMIWMLGDFTPLNGEAPWYYSAAPGLENADALVVPLCPMSPAHRAVALRTIEESSVDLSGPMRSDLMLVFRIEH
jgi:hypothetical protein